MIGSYMPVEYGVFFLLDGERHFDTVLASTPYQACDAAEKSHPGCEVKSVSVSMRVLGKCICGMTIFEGEEKYRQTPVGLRCSNCLPSFDPRPPGSFSQTADS